VPRGGDSGDRVPGELPVDHPDPPVLLALDVEEPLQLTQGLREAGDQAGEPGEDVVGARRSGQPVRPGRVAWFHARTASAACSAQRPGSAVTAAAEDLEDVLVKALLEAVLLCQEARRWTNVAS